MEKKERALLVGVDNGEEQDFDRYMAELGSLAEACNMEVVCIHTQNLPNPNTALYVGSGSQSVRFYLYRV